MAENPLEGLIGGEGEDGPDAPGGGADAAAIALALDGAKYDRKLAKKARAYLTQQTRLVSIQTEHLHEQRAVQISHLKLKRDGEFLKVILQTLVIALAASFVLILATMAWSASQDHGLVVEAFSVPPDLAQGGVTGQVAAKQVLDRLAKLQAETVSVRPSNSYRNNWSDDLKVEIPETGISLGEVQRLLNGWLGHETHISGEIVHSPTGLTITSRSGEEAADPVSGAESDLDALIQRAAEAVYRQTQPYRYAVYLAAHAREAEAADIHTQQTKSADPTERAWAHVGLANLAVKMGNISESSRQQRLALQESPDFTLARVDLLVNDWRLRRDEILILGVRDLREDQRALRQFPQRGRGALARLSAYELPMNQDVKEGDRLRKTARTVWPGDSWQSFWADSLYDDVTHDPAGLTRAAPPERPDQIAELECELALRLHTPARRDLCLRALQLDQAIPERSEEVRREDVYRIAVAKAEFGDLAGAKALIFATPTDCYECVMGRGQILAMAGDRAGAEQWFAEAIRQGPDVPLAFTARGEARLVWGDGAGALADGQAATKISPNDPDALKLWGDALARQGQAKAAREKYDAGLKLAPNWVDLQKARAAAAKG